MNSDSPLTARRAVGASQRDRIAALVGRHPRRHVHVVDIMYRLTAPALNAEGMQLWEDSQGELAGFAVWQPAFKMVDYGFDVRAGERRMAELVSSWAEEWFGDSVRDQGVPRTCWIKVPETNVAWRAVVEARGFHRCRWSVAHLQASLDRPLSAPDLPDGFSVREVTERDADACAILHRAVFPGAEMTTDWRREIMRTSTYATELDLVVVAPDGSLAAFCLGWIGRLESEVVGQIEPFGTHPAHRQRRLGSAVVRELMRRMQAKRVTRLVVDTWDDNLHALHAYKSVGFAQTSIIPTYAREF